MKRIRGGFVTWIVVFLAFSWVLAAGPDRPDLVVLIIVDGLGQEQLLRQWGRLEQGGFRAFLEAGAWFAQSRFQHVTTLTAVGHATIPTGAQPMDHGIVGNEWVDRDTGEVVYCVEDETHKRLGEPTSAHAGTSPKNLRCSTIGDELHLSTGRKSKVFGISIKDRGAILPAGKLGKAYFFSNASGKFITTDYYMPDYPGWWNRYYSKSPQDQWMGNSWVPVRHENPAAMGDSPGTQPFARLPERAAAGYYLRLAETPFANDYLLEFALAVIDGEALGRNPAGVPDFISISLSTHDYVNHGFSPDSPRSEDNVLQMDRSLARFFAALDQRIRRDRVLFVLTADHGFGANPEEQAQAGLEAGRIRTRDLESKLNRHLCEKFGEQPYVIGFYNPTFYFHQDKIQAAGVSLEEVENESARFLGQHPGIAWAFTRGQLMNGSLPEIPLARAAQYSWNPQLSGGVLLIQKSGWFLLKDGDALAATHGSPYHYDTDVPLMFSGKWIRPGMRGEEAAVVDLAPTLAAILKVRSPTAASGRVLAEILRD